MNAWVRKGNIILSGVLLVLFSLFLWLFLDPVLKWALIRAGQSAAGAKVEIGAVRSRLLSGRLELDGVAVADKSEPMKNVVEFDRAAFEISFSAAIRAKVDISDAELTGLRFGTPRKTSGKLAVSKPTALDKLVEKGLAPAKERLRTNLGLPVKAPADVEPSKLQSLKALDGAQGALDGVQKKWKDRLATDKIDAQIKQIQAEIKTLQSGGSAPADIARKAQDAAKLRGQINDLLKQVNESKTALTQDLGQVEISLKNAQSLKLQDLNALLAAAGLPVIDPDSLTKRLIGPAAASRAKTALHWIAWARAHMASQSSKRPTALRRGVNIEFPHKRRKLPAFLLEKAKLSGALAGLFEGREMALSGELGGVTSNPPLYGKPARLELRGAVAGGGPTMDLAGLLDQTKSPGNTEVSFHYAGLPLAGATLGDSEIGARLKSGAARVSGTIRVLGDEWKGQVMIQADGVSLDPKLDLPADQAKYAALALQSVRRFNATLGIEGRESDLHFTLSSDLGSALAAGMKQAVSKEFTAQRQELEKKIDALYAAKAGPLQQKLGEQQSTLLGPLNAQQAELQKALNDAVSRSFGPKIPDLNKLFR